jgi:molybdopterin converting factor small subunit
MNFPKVKLKLWMNDWPGWSQAGPMILEEPIEPGDPLRTLLSRLAERMPQFRETIFDPLTQTISGEVALVINDRVQSPSLGLEMKLQDGDEILFFPYLAGG